MVASLRARGVSAVDSSAPVAPFVLQKLLDSAVAHLVHLQRSGQSASAQSGRGHADGPGRMFMSKMETASAYEAG